MGFKISRMMKVPATKMTAQGSDGDKEAGIILQSKKGGRERLPRGFVGNLSFYLLLNS